MNLPCLFSLILSSCRYLFGEIYAVVVVFSCVSKACIFKLFDMDFLWFFGGGVGWLYLIEGFGLMIVRILVSESLL